MALVIPFPSLSAQETRTVISSSVKADLPSPINPGNENKSGVNKSFNGLCVTHVNSAIDHEVW